MKEAVVRRRAAWEPSSRNRGYSDSDATEINQAEGNG